MPVSGGSVIIANTAAGKWYLYGGTASALAGVLVSFVASAGPRRRGAAPMTVDDASFRAGRGPVRERDRRGHHRRAATP